MRFNKGDKVIIRNKPNFSGKTGTIIDYSLNYNGYIIKIDKKYCFVSKKLVTTELEYFIEEMTNDIQ